ncbi:hypothetical protein AAA450_11730 [Staphylococcus equorum]
MTKYKDTLNKSVTHIKKAMGIKNPDDEKVSNIKTYRDYLDKNI